MTNRDALAPALGGYILVTEQPDALDDALREPGHTLTLMTDGGNHAEATLMSNDGSPTDGHRFTMLRRLTSHERRT